jgi:hypothetical protein
MMAVVACRPEDPARHELPDLKVPETVMLLFGPPVGTKRHVQAGQETPPNTFAPCSLLMVKRTKRGDRLSSNRRRSWVAPNVDNGLTMDLEIKVVGLGIYE